MKNFLQRILKLLGLVKPVVEVTPVISAEPVASEQVKKKKKKQRRSARQRKLTNLRARAREIFWVSYRGDMNCGYCGEQTSRNLPDDHPLRATVEHIVPISRGGTNKPKNMMLACFKCNQIEAAKKDFGGRTDKVMARKQKIDSKYYGKVSGSK